MGNAKPLAVGFILCVFAHTPQQRQNPLKNRGKKVIASTFVPEVLKGADFPELLEQACKLHPTFGLSIFVLQCLGVLLSVTSVSVPHVPSQTAVGAALEEQLLWLQEGRAGAPMVLSTSRTSLMGFVTSGFWSGSNICSER